jgi:hypothetical protein
MSQAYNRVEFKVSQEGVSVVYRRTRPGATNVAAGKRVIPTAADGKQNWHAVEAAVAELQNQHGPEAVRMNPAQARGG